MLNIAIFTGEISGSLYARYIIPHIRREYGNEVSFWGIGNIEMEKVGFLKIWDIKELSIIGLFEAIKSLHRIIKMKREIIKEIAIRKPKLILYIDSPGFNIILH